MKIFKKIIMVAGVAGLVATACNKKFDSMLENPNQPLPSQADADLYVNQIQLAFPGYFDAIQTFGAEFTRQMAFTGANYTNGYSPQSYSGTWSSAYTSIVKNADALIELAAPRRQTYHVGIAYILKGYTMMTMVDCFGDVPYTEANKGNANTNPKLDPGKNVYNAAIALLDSGIANMGRTPSTNVAADMYYGHLSSAASRRAAWATLAKTLKLRAYLNLRLSDAAAATAGINALITGGDLIDTDAEDFTFRYGTQLANPNTRHPRYNDGYRASGGAGGYIGTYFMHAIAVEKILLGQPRDPRREFYFYRQAFAPGSQAQQPCAYNAAPGHYGPDDPFCYTLSGHWGRDHGDNSGTPPDGGQRTVWGIYPAGGKFDDVSVTAVGINDGAKGAGIHPIWMSWFTDFTLMEAGITLSGVNLTAAQEKAYFLSGINKNMARVFGYGATVGLAIPSSALTTAASRQTTYVNGMSNLWDAAATDAAKLDLGLKEYYLTTWGNGIESWNMYRRTSRPRALQPMLVASPGAFIRSFYYPADFANLNTNGSQKAGPGVKVFWDTNPDALF